MTRPPLRQRITAALRLQPMTVDQLARCLTVSCSAVRNALGYLEILRRAVRYRVHPRIRRNGAPPFVYEVRA